ncbi:TIGR03086 family metal-binding protein [Sphaerisporangium aureirubrum]|uniref:TIGR03086 family metal-binding protein n=1 Tax=Sphaerisporangium aureirubrum TaxID=1544736 RepID=A0ABW1NLX0_9ACTN
MDMSDGLKLMAEAHDYLRAVTRGVPEHRWGAPTPCAEWTTRQVLNHACLAQLAYVHAFEGPERRVNPFDPPDAFDAPPADALDEAIARLNAAWASLPSDAADAPTPFGRVPIWLAAGAPAMDAAVHAWDIARSTAQPLPLSDDLADRIIPVAEHLVPPMRDTLRLFAPALPSPATASPTTRLLHYLGRTPTWSPAH